MDTPWSPWSLSPESTTGGKKHKRSFSEKSMPLIKRPRLLSVFRGLMHRKARSVGSLQTRQSSGELSSFAATPFSARSRSLDQAKKPSRFKQRRGQTPGMDDYLTLAELESVWTTQDCFLGCYDAPSRAQGYTYTDPVEAPTVTKHQYQQETLRPQRRPIHVDQPPAPAPSYLDDVRVPSPLRPRKSTHQSTHQSIHQSTHQSIRQSTRQYTNLRPSPPESVLSSNSIRPPSPLRPRKAPAHLEIPVPPLPDHFRQQHPARLAPIKHETVPRASQSTARHCPTEDRSQKHTSAWSRYPTTPVHTEHVCPQQPKPERRKPKPKPLQTMADVPTFEPSRAMTISPSIYSQPTPRRVPSPVSDVRNAVVSGVVHPALRPSPYFDRTKAAASCRAADGMNVHSQPGAWAYGRV